MAAPNAETAPATGSPTPGPAPGQAVAPNGAASTPAAPPQPSLQEQLVEARRQQSEASQRAENMTRAYQGLQRTLSQAQAELARANTNANLLSAIPALVRGQQELILATKGPEAASQFAQSVENETLKAQLAARTQFANPSGQVETPTPAAQPQVSKADVLHRWYPGTELNPDDPLIDYAGDAQTVDEAQRRFHSSVAKAAAIRAGERASQATTQEAAESTREALVRAGVETTEGGLPSGPPKPRPADDDPAKWNPRQMLTAGFEQSGSPHDKLLERQARRTKPGEKELSNAAAVVPTVAAR